MYGVINSKFYVDSSSMTSVDALKMAGKVEHFEAREKIFDENRKALMKIIRFVPHVVTKMMNLLLI